MKRLAIGSGLVVLLLSLASCASTPPPAPVAIASDPVVVGDPRPTGRLPSTLRPTHYALKLRIVPDEERFSGEVSIDIESTIERNLIWVHASEMNVTEVHVSRDGAADIAATFEAGPADGVAALHLAQMLPVGRATVHFTYDAPYERTLKGLYRVNAGGAAYAFTQFEPISARLAFPCFDEPAFKTPFDVSLIVKAEHVAIANTRVREEQALENGMKVVHFRTTEALPTYLIAFAVGPLDVVEASAIPPSSARQRSIPFRGVAVHGRGAELAYALEHTPALLEELERYFGIEYPYDKLDIIAVPDFAAGAMENAGAITFREPLLLINPESASEDQYRGFTSVMAHELAHQWFGNLVTMPWWDDIWLNEAFATWMSYRIVNNVRPEYASMTSFRERTSGAMGSDSLASARQIRQPIESNHDIRNAFDGITYSKGGAVIAMFERFVGEGTFQRGIHAYLEAHRFGNATQDDFLAAISQVAGRDVATPFRTFLNQPGVPLVTTELSCEPESRRIIARQSRYVPVGSTASADALWQIPFCVRYEVNRESHDACAMLNHAEEHLTLPDATCPTWIMPNADGVGYYRFAMSSTDLRNLRDRGWARLNARERMALADSLRAGFSAGTISAADLLSALPIFAGDSTRQIATTPMGILDLVRDWMPDQAGRDKVEAFARRLYTPQYNRLGWDPGRRDDGETRLLRADLIDFLALTAHHPAARREAVRRGRSLLRQWQGGPADPFHTSPELVDVSLAVLVEESDVDVWEAFYNVLTHSDDAIVRSRVLQAIARARVPALSDRVLALTLDPALRVNEALGPLGVQIGQLETRERAWAWLEQHFDEIVARVSPTGASYLPWYAGSFCDEDHATHIESFFAPRIETLSGGPRNLRGATEAIRLCSARKAAHLANVIAYFAQHRS